MICLSWSLSLFAYVPTIVGVFFKHIVCLRLCVLLLALALRMALALFLACEFQRYAIGRQVYYVSIFV